MKPCAQTCDQRPPGALMRPSAAAAGEVAEEQPLLGSVRATENPTWTRAPTGRPRASRKRRRRPNLPPEAASPAPCAASWTRHPGGLRPCLAGSTAAARAGALRSALQQDNRCSGDGRAEAAAAAEAAAEVASRPCRQVHGSPVGIAGLAALSSIPNMRAPAPVVVCTLPQRIPCRRTLTSEEAPPPPSPPAKPFCARASDGNGGRTVARTPSGRAGSGWPSAKPIRDRSLSDEAHGRRADVAIAVRATRTTGVYAGQQQKGPHNANTCEVWGHHACVPASTPERGHRFSVASHLITFPSLIYMDPRACAQPSRRSRSRSTTRLVAHAL
eukprot:366399-Chlamydomonas_euryale.AAC.56